MGPEPPAKSFPVPPGIRGVWIDPGSFGPGRQAGWVWVQVTLWSLSIALALAPVLDSVVPTNHRPPSKKDMFRVLTPGARECNLI